MFFMISFLFDYTVCVVARLAFKHSWNYYSFIVIVDIGA